MDFQGILHIKSQGKLKCVKRYSCQLLPAGTDASQYVKGVFSLTRSFTL